MPKDNKNFFKEKKIWSEVKDELLGCYLVPYFSKILSMGSPMLYVDCFAGKGKFDDGKPGSPLIALDSLNNILAKSTNAPTVIMKFIELNHAADLENNLPSQHKRRCQVISGKFENEIIPLLQAAKQNHNRLNVFLYVDPYGVKVLNANLFDSLANAFNTAELLINFNSFGFIREACRVQSVAFREREDEIFSDLDEYDSSVLDSIQELNDIAGGDYWVSIINDYSQNKIDCYQAEKEFSRQYKKRLQQSYAYVLDMPIRLKPGQHPKYRMVHATNHHDGCILMADDMAKRTDRLVIEIQGDGQMSIVPLTADNEMVCDDVLIDNVKKLLASKNQSVRLNSFLADFFNEYGVLCGTSRIKNSALKVLEKSGYIEVNRVPSMTKTGKVATSWTDGKEYTISLRIRR